MKEYKECVCCGHDMEYIGDRPDGAKLYQCSACGFATRDGSIYDDSYYSEDYYDYSDGSIIENHKARYQMVQYIVEDLTSKEVLDIGCGLGYFLDNMAASCKDVYGVELSEYASQYCKGKGLKVYNTSLEDFRTEQKFDLITAWEVIEHVDDLRVFLKDVKCLLKPNGIFMLSTPNAGSYRAKKNGLQWQGFNRSLEHLYYFTAVALKELLTEIFPESRISFLEFDWRSEDSLVAIVECGVHKAALREGMPERVLYVGRNNGLSVAGGDMVQLFRTRSAVNDIGITVDVSLCALPGLQDDIGYDVIHQFGLTNAESVDQLCRLHPYIGKMALSSIYWNLEETKLYTQMLEEVFKEGLRNGNIDYLLDLFADSKIKLENWKSYDTFYKQLQEERGNLLKEVPHILPNSFGEMEELRQNFKLYRTHYTVVPNSVDVNMFSEAKPELFIDKYGLKDFVLCAARLEPRKNILMLIIAANRLGLPLVLTGSKHVPGYVDLCERYAGSNVHFIEYIPHSLLASAYAAARVHALISWCESPGLSSIEAALTGCNIVVSDRGPMYEYFGEAAYYCDHGDIDSITEALERAWNDNDISKKEALKRRIMENYTWDKTAEKTVEAYEKILARSKKNVASHEEYVIKIEDKHVKVAADMDEIKRIAIFGAALTGEECLKAAIESGIEVEFFIDNSPARQGTLFNGLPVYSVEEAMLKGLSERIDAIILASAGYQKQMEEQLRSVGWKSVIVPANKFLN